MKITDLAIVFILFTIPFFILVEIRSDNLEYISYKQVEINRMLDTAIEDGISALVQDDDINKNRAVDAFFRSLFINFNILDNTSLKNRLSNYIPVIVVVENDGFNILSLQEFSNVIGKKEMKMIWNPKVLYSYSDDKFIYQFFLDDKLNVYEKESMKLYKGTNKTICEEIDVSNSILEDEAIFNSVKKREIIRLLQRDINYEINKQNDIIKNLGIDYYFSLPVITNDDWTNTISDIGMLVFFQGLPIGNQGDRYSNFVLGGSKLLKSKKYYVVTNINTGKKEYHTKDCIILKDVKLDIKMNPEDTIFIVEEFNTKFEAAKTGAFPCELFNK
ncbi:MAG: hypothetical protein U9N10_02960 [Bacillota bacterium]|nr:hypothetical protein [Bacillota bacterium]